MFNFTSHTVCPGQPNAAADGLLAEPSAAASFEICWQLRAFSK